MSDISELVHVSDNYIVTYEISGGSIFLFNRKGQIVSHFNRKGQSSQDYPRISGGVVFDEKNEEIFVCGQTAVQVYTINGGHKRTLKIIPMENITLYNFDNETLLVYEDIVTDLNEEKSFNKKPYRLVSKKDGSDVAILDIYLPQRYSTRTVQLISKKTSGTTTTATVRSHIIRYDSNSHYGQDFVIADRSSDTMYLLTQDKKLTPILTRKPSVHASEPRKVWTTLFTSDKYLFFEIITLDFNKSEGGRNPVFIYEFKTGEVYETSISNTEHVKRDWSPHWSPHGSAATTKNMTADLMDVSRLKDADRNNRLKGEFKKLVATLDEDDNPIIMIVKFK